MQRSDMLGAVQGADFYFVWERYHSSDIRLQASESSRAAEACNTMGTRGKEFAAEKK